MSERTNSKGEKPNIIAISISDRYHTTEPIRILIAQPGKGVELKLVHWPPPLLEPTPVLYARFLKEALGDPAGELFSKALIFVDAPITVSKSGLRQSELGFPDIDPQNNLIGNSLKDYCLDSRCRSSLELFHALLWRGSWPKNNLDSDLDNWRRHSFRLEGDQNGERNLYEIHIGDLAIFEVAGDHKRPGKPNSKTTAQKLKTHLDRFFSNNVDGKSIDARIHDESNQRLLLTFAIGYLWWEQNDNEEWRPWKLFGEPAENDNGVWREGEVIGPSMESPVAVTLDKPLKGIPDSLIQNNIWLSTSFDPAKLIQSKYVKDRQHENDLLLANKNNENQLNVWRYSTSFIEEPSRIGVLSVDPGKSVIRINPISLLLSDRKEIDLYYLCPWEQVRSCLRNGALTGINQVNKYSLGLQNDTVYRIMIGGWSRVKQSLQVTFIAEVLAQGKFKKDKSLFSLKFDAAYAVQPTVRKFGEEDIEHYNLGKDRKNKKEKTIRQVSGMSFLVPKACMENPHMIIEYIDAGKGNVDYRILITLKITDRIRI